MSELWKKLFLILILMVPFGVVSQDAETIFLLQDVARYNSICRGGSGSSNETWKACGARDYIGALLYARGYCFGKEGQAGYQMEWHLCEANSDIWLKPDFSEQLAVGWVLAPIILTAPGSRPPKNDG